MSPTDALREALSQETPDASVVLNLAHQMAKADPDIVRFSVDASHISRLGLELVSKQETAVAELIKNAYDADAITVDLIFKDSESPGGTLEIVDNGQGMSREELRDGFMRISTQAKVDRPVSSQFLRQRAGRKGIGRFATQRLGTRLEIVTQLESEDHALALDIDWKLFESGKDLFQISNQIRVLPRKSTAGTTLRIVDLRDAWTEQQIKRTFRYVSELLQPFPLEKKPSRTAKKRSDPGFKVAFYREQLGDIFSIADEEQSILAHAFAQFSGWVDDHGTPWVQVASKKYNLKDKPKALEFDPRVKPKTGLPVNGYPLLVGIRFEASYFIQDVLPAGARTSVREVLTNFGGIRLYRNGFRVLPYGEQFDDWLGLQRSSALREVLPPHHNNNFVGFVEITDVAGARFEETASREGLLENEAFGQLKDFIYRALMVGVLEIARVRDRKQFATDKAKPKEPSQENSALATALTPHAKAALVADQIRAIVAEVSTSSKDTATSLNTQERVEAVVEKLVEIADVSQERIDETQQLLQENGMLRVLASLGLTIGEFTHEVRHALAALEVTVGALTSEGISEKSIADATRNIGLLRSYARYFDEAISRNSNRELKVHELRDVVADFAEVLRPTLDRQSVNLTTRFDDHDLFVKPMHFSEWASILLNLFTNSLKAIHRAQNQGKIDIHAGRVGDSLFLEFSDNGDGIPAANVERIFDAFFTTSAPSGPLASESEQLVGTGLGLKIVRDIVDAANGDIRLVTPNAGYSTCFRIEMPSANDEEIGDARY
jgi:signal transduction histidine kinase